MLHALLSPSGTISGQVNGLRALESVALFQLLPSADGAGLHTDHVLPAVLGRKVGRLLRLIGPGVEDDGVLEVVTNDAEALLAAFRDDEGVLGALGRGVHAVRLAGEGNCARLGLGGEAIDLVDVGCVLEARDLNVLDIL